MLNDIYPILKLILKFYQERTQKDYSYQMIVNNKLTNVLETIYRKSEEEY